MISHKHKIIFIHIPKCAGSSIETAFGIDVENNQGNREFLFGWDQELKIHLQHATPQQLLDFELVNHHQWYSYFKFIIIRNTWDKVISDYFWFKRTKNFEGSFEDYLFKKNSFKRFLNNEDNTFRGDHHNPQIDYMFIDGKIINYDAILTFDKVNLDNNLKELSSNLGFNQDFLNKKVQVGSNLNKHYSKFYNDKRKKLVYKKFKKDIEYFDFSYVDKKNLIDKLILKIKPI